jgi:hypothetical protein
MALLLFDGWRIAMVGRRMAFSFQAEFINRPALSHLLVESLWLACRVLL